MPVKDMNSHQHRKFSIVVINRMYKQEILFFCSLLQAYVDFYDCITDIPNLELVNDISILYNNMINPLELKEQNLLKCNRAFISVVYLALLYYVQNECFNLFQRVID